MFGQEKKEGVGQQVEDSREKEQCRLKIDQLFEDQKDLWGE